MIGVEEFYGFGQMPFSRAIPTDKLYRGNEIDELIDRLKFVADRQLFAVVTGDSGTGKTTVLRSFNSALMDKPYKVLYIADSKLTPRVFYKEALEQLGFEARFYRGDAKRQLFTEILKMKESYGITPVVIADESHLFDREMLEEVRFLLNCQMDSESHMSLILAGQLELWEKLKLKNYEAIRQRIDVRCVIGKQDRSHTAGYIKAHLDYAGCGRDIFTEAAIDEIYKYSGGICRKINSCCTNSLMYGAQNNKNLIDDRMVSWVIECELN
jgi:type II secretory pathway predicted ATPase ExeA